MNSCGQSWRAGAFDKLRPGLPAPTPIFLAALWFGLSGCAAVGTVAEIAGAASGQKALAGAGKSLARSAEVEEFTEEEKYYTGRTVAAQLLTTEKVSAKADFERYIGRVGQGVAQASGRAELPEGWHFILLEDSHPNAYACPGGLVFVSQGLVDLCQDEDELAGVLAHEIAHVALDHPMSAISAANKKAALLGLAEYGVSQVVKDSSAEAMASTFGNVVSEVGKVVSHGYDRALEEDADIAAVKMCVDLGYDPRGLKRVLLRLREGDASHGKPSQRAEVVEEAAYNEEPVPKVHAHRTERFRKWLSRS